MKNTEDYDSHGLNYYRPGLAPQWWEIIHQPEDEPLPIESIRPLAWLIMMLGALAVSTLLYLFPPSSVGDATGLPPMVGKGVQL